MTTSSVKLEDTDGYPSASYLERSNKAYLETRGAMDRAYVPTILSNLFRATALIFLRVVRYNSRLPGSDTYAPPGSTERREGCAAVVICEVSDCNLVMPNP
jgi:hypothetical protein